MNVPGFGKPVLLIGREAMNRAVNGDFVVVEIYPRSEWKAPGEEVVDQESMLWLSVYVADGSSRLSGFAG